jgi:hypothetical protein
MPAHRVGGQGMVSVASLRCTILLGAARQWWGDSPHIAQAIPLLREDDRVSIIA